MVDMTVQAQSDERDHLLSHRAQINEAFSDSAGTGSGDDGDKSENKAKLLMSLAIDSVPGMFKLHPLSHRHTI
jgi:hypothetical protein